MSPALRRAARLALALSLAAAAAAMAGTRPPEIVPFAPPLREFPSPSDAILFAVPDAGALRARLLAHADTMAVRDVFEAGRALAYRATSFARAGEPDSAIADFERAFRIDPRPERRMDLSGALMHRLATGDAQRALEILRPIQPVNPELPDMSQAPVQGSLAWAHYLTGNSDSAAVLFAPVESWLSVYPEWRYRLACVAIDRHDFPRAIILLTPLAALSRNSDRDVMGLLKQSAKGLDVTQRLMPDLARNIGMRDQIEMQVVNDLNARRLGFTGHDGFPIGGVLLTPAAARPRAAIVLMAPGDTLAEYDTLAVGLRRMGLAVMLVEPRGSGRSVGERCPLPDSWRGREAEMQGLCAGDVREALRALARETKADTTRYLLVGVGATAPIAVEAARRDRRAAVLMLVSPDPAPVDAGTMRATLASLRRPVYFQTAPGDHQTWAVIDSLYRACDQRASRVAESGGLGHFAGLFRRDPKILERFRLWLSESWPRAGAPRATPRPRPRTG